MSIHPILADLITQLEHDLAAANQERYLDNLPTLSQLHITMLGQMALRVHHEIPAELHLAQTADMDALLNGDWATRAIFKKCLADHHLVYDEHSAEIWIPPLATFTTGYESPLLFIDIIDPLFALTSKAVKAPHKNKILIQEALAIYGEALITHITSSGGDIEFFVS